MSTETRHRCDVCGELITAGRTLLTVQSGPERLRRTEIDFCPRCLPRLTALLDADDGSPGPTPADAASERLEPSGATS